jgi:hypothetical protein
MSIRTVPRASFCAALVLGAVATAFGGTSPEDEAVRLDDHYFFVQKIGHGWEPLLADMERSLVSLKDAPAEKLLPLRTTVDAARESVAKLRLADRTEPGESRALELYDLLAQTAVDKSRWPEFHKACADILMKRADAAANVNDEQHDAKAFDLAMSALRHVPDLDRAFGMIARLGLKVGLKAKEREDYETALEKLSGTLETLGRAGGKAAGKAIKDVSDVVDEIRRTTGTLAISWLGDPKALANVKGGKTDFTHAALAFVGDAKSPPTQTADKPRRVRVGTWKVTATGSGGGKPFEAGVVVTPGGGEMTMPAMIPDGMVYVPAQGVDDAFLIDRTETSNDQFAAMTGRSRGGDGRAAAAGLTYQEAKNAAEGAGKRLPNVAQWTHAAFGAPNAKSPRYPWGDSEGEPGVQFVGGVDGPQDVASCEAGASRFGCINMAGNVWEWIEHDGGGWLIGGGWSGKFSRNVLMGETEPWLADFLRDPLPTKETYDAFPVSDKANNAKYQNYKATAETTLPQAGMRCVIPLGKPWRRP